MKQSSTVSGRGQKKTGTGGANRRSSGASAQQRSNGRGSGNSRDSDRRDGGSDRNGGMRANSDSSDRANMGTTNSRQARSASRSSGHFEGQSHLEKFFLDQLQDIYYAEQKIVQSLPKMQQAATTGELKEAFEDHLHQTQRHVKRLEKVFETLGKHAEGKKCEAIEGIAREVESIIGETEEGTLTRDAALIIAAQKVEHYEIATYGGLVQLAITMQLHDAADLLDKTLVEEEDTDARLTEIAENEINLGAEHEGNQYSWDAQGEEGGQEDVDEKSPSV